MQDTGVDVQIQFSSKQSRVQCWSRCRNRDRAVCMLSRGPYGSCIQEMVEQQFHIAELNLPEDGLHFSTVCSEPIVSMTMGESFDFFLLRATQSVGASLRTQCQVLKVEQETDRVLLSTSSGTVSAQFVLAADGASSRVADSSGWTNTPDLISALECEMRVCNRVLERFQGRARFDFNLVPSGYA